MNVNNDFFSFIDFLGINEDIINIKLESIIERSSFSNKLLMFAYYLLKYKLYVNDQEKTECSIEKELNFVAKLVNSLNTENLDYICCILEVVLNLNTKSTETISEHLIQQLLAECNQQEQNMPRNLTENAEFLPKNLLLLNVIDAILEALVKKGIQLNTPYIEMPLEKLLDEGVVERHFLLQTVPRCFQVITGYNVLDNIWLFLKNKGLKCSTSVRILSSLSNYYLPDTKNGSQVKYKSNIIYDCKFWDLICEGISSADITIRKMSIYVMKRAIDYVACLQKNVDCNSFKWDLKHNEVLQKSWCNFFVLLESLEEKQSNIVLPSLQLFDNINEIGDHWIMCLYRIGLCHENTFVRHQCLERRLSFDIKNEKEALLIMNAMNDVALYDKERNNELLLKHFKDFFTSSSNFVSILKSIGNVAWSPVPLYFVTSVLANLNIDLSNTESSDSIDSIISIMKIACNNIDIRKAVNINMSYFVGNCYKNWNWKHFIDLYPLFSFDEKTCNILNPFIEKIINLSLDDKEKSELFTCLTSNHNYMDLCFLYLQNNPSDIKLFYYFVSDKSEKIHEAVSRQYYDRTNNLNDAIFLIKLYLKCRNDLNHQQLFTHYDIKSHLNTLLSFILCLMAGEQNLNMREHTEFFELINEIQVDDANCKQTLLKLKDTALLFLKDSSTNIDQLLFSMVVMNFTLKSTVVNDCEIISLAEFIEIIKNLKLLNTNDGRTVNILYEKTCEVIHSYLQYKDVFLNTNLKDLAAYIGNVLICGGYGCLKWILRIINCNINVILYEQDAIEFLKTIWKDMEEIKTNSEYPLCIKEFVDIITNDIFLNKNSKHIEMDDIKIFYEQIVESGAIKNTPIFYLVRKLNTIHISAKDMQIVLILHKILLHCPLLKRDQRITTNTIIELMSKPSYCVGWENLHTHFDFQIQMLATCSLYKTNDQKILLHLANTFMNEIKDLFKNKSRYHFNSYTHRILTMSLQHLISILCLAEDLENLNDIFDWSILLLGKLPHQPSSRTCLEWLMTICILKMNTELNNSLIELFKIRNVSVLSQLLIVFHVMKHRLKIGIKHEYNFVMNMLLSNTMGQIFNIRLHAQYLAMKLYVISDCMNSAKYEYIINVIENTFKECSDDKSLKKINNDFFINSFDVFANMTPCFIYYFVPNYFKDGENQCYVDYFRTLLNDMNGCLYKREKMCKDSHLTDEDIFSFDFSNYFEKNNDNIELNYAKTIQKKYIPWNDMNGIDVCTYGDEKTENPSELIVVASLIDKLPNLGGMARTSDVFGVKTYVVDSLRHLEDKQFQGLSVSAERWINIEEVRPGNALKEYLLRKKLEGYTVVAAEQTSSSCKLQSFKFPKKTLLLLGHEKEGIPCDLLSIMDHCVEIEQRGLVRSLNVHVTAAIFVWEYCRQNIFS